MKKDLLVVAGSVVAGVILGGLALLLVRSGAISASGMFQVAYIGIGCAVLLAAAVLAYTLRH